MSIAEIANSLVRKLRRGVSFFLGVSCRVWMQLLGVKLGKGVEIRGWVFVSLYPGSHILIGDNVRLNADVRSNPVNGGAKMVLATGKTGARITIGNNAGISSSVIYSREEISIGDGTLIGAGCSIYDNDFHDLDSNCRGTNNEKIMCCPVSIGKNVWLGAETMVLKGSVIGDGSVVGAGSLVSGCVESGVIAVGRPAKTLRKL